MVRERQTAIFYTTAVCNLNCVYCYIDKNPALVTIDNILDESFKGEYYFDFVREMFPDPYQLTNIEFWGGEPTLRLDRAIHTVTRLIDFYPNLNSFYMSTNFTNNEWNKQFFGFIDMLNSYPERQFHFLLQLSLDGPEYINDAQRGKGVTKRFSKQFISFIDSLNKRGESNVSFELAFKPTLTSDIIRAHLLDKEGIIKYYRFFETFLSYFKRNIKVSNVSCNHPIPNMACPSPHTQKDGIEFAQFCRLCREIEKENNTNKIFNFYGEITPFVPRTVPNYNNTSYCQSCGACGSGKYNVGFLPYDMISCCHNGFTNLISDYKKKSLENTDNNKVLDFKLFMSEDHYMIQTKESYKQYEKNVDMIYNPCSKTKIANMASIITLLGLTKQIDPKYKYPKEALKAALFMQQATSYCMRDNVAVTGSAGLYPIGQLRLLLNGAREAIENYG